LRKSTRWVYPALRCIDGDQCQRLFTQTWRWYQQLLYVEMIPIPTRYQQNSGNEFEYLTGLRPRKWWYQQLQYIVNMLVPVRYMPPPKYTPWHIQCVETWSSACALLLTCLLILFLHTASPVRAICNHPCRQLQISDIAPHAVKYIVVVFDDDRGYLLGIASTSDPGGFSESSIRELFRIIRWQFRFYCY
jgi:hypothetical protein